MHLPIVSGALYVLGISIKLHDHFGTSSTGTISRKLTDNNYWNDVDSWEDWLCLFGAVACVISAGIASGLTIGLLSIDRLKLQVKMECGTADEKRYAEVSSNQLSFITTIIITTTDDHASCPP